MTRQKNTQTKPSVHDRLTVLKHLASGRDSDMVAAAMKMTRFDVIDIASQHGYPDPVKMAKAVTLITQRLQRDEEDALTETDDASEGHVPSHAAGTEVSNAGDSASTAELHDAETGARAGRVWLGVGGPLPKPDEIRVLLNTAKTLTSFKRIERQTEKVLAEIARLRELVTAEQAKAEAAAAEKAERQSARAEIQRLEEQLRQAKARLRGATAPKTAPTASTSRTGEPSAKEIRAWALQQADLTCPATGRIPATVRAAYDAAHRTAAA
jgi:hypothetical protein